MSMLSIALRLVFFLGILGLLLFGSAGRLDLPFFWAYYGLFGIGLVVIFLLLDRDLLQERVRPAAGGQDRHLRTVGFAMSVIQWVLAGLDVGRFHWSDTIPTGLRVAGLAGLFVAMITIAWIMRTNPFFSPVVRIQSERGHRLITSGPYAIVRHPGYLTAVLMFLSGGLALGSWVAMMPLPVVLAMILRRTRLEDRFLHENLPGYPQYASQVTSRLLPGVW
jgi:protein-S-isoprenylcysteine O-methyltransferase Ste14